jgi:hypothetical protein
MKGDRDMGKYTTLEKKIEREIEEISHKDLTGPALEVLDKMAHTLKSLKTIDAMEGYAEDDGYHHDGMSYARGRGTYADRDTMGRYTSESRRWEDGEYPERRR